MAEQPMPKPGREGVFPALMADIEDRNEKGRLTYGRDLETFNGRDALRDAYEEALDLAVYLKQALMEREAMRQDLRRSFAYGNLHLSNHSVTREQIDRAAEAIAREES